MATGSDFSRSLETVPVLQPTASGDFSRSLENLVVIAPQIVTAAGTTGPSSGGPGDGALNGHSTLTGTGPSSGSAGNGALSTPSTITGSGPSSGSAGNGTLTGHSTLTGAGPSSGTAGDGSLSGHSALTGTGPTSGSGGDGVLSTPSTITGSGPSSGSGGNGTLSSVSTLTGTGPVSGAPGDGVIGSTITLTGDGGSGSGAGDGTLTVPVVSARLTSTYAELATTCTPRARLTSSYVEVATPQVYVPQPVDALDWEVRLYSPLAINLLLDLGAYWRFEEASGAARLDSSGNGCTLSEEGSVGREAAQVNNGAVDSAWVHGVTPSHYLQMDSNAHVQLGNAPWYIGGWVKQPLDGMGYTRVICGKWSGNGGDFRLEYQIWFDGTYYHFDSSPDGTHGGFGGTIGQASTDGRWDYIAVWFNPGTNQWFSRCLSQYSTNTALARSAVSTYGAAPFAGNIPFTFLNAYKAPSGLGGYDGGLAVDQWGIWHRALSETEMLYLSTPSYAADYPFPAPFARSYFPNDQFDHVVFEKLEEGGCSRATLHMQAPWEQFQLTGLERVDIYLKGFLRWRGSISLPTHDLKFPESKSFQAFGYMVRGQGTKCANRYGFAVDTDISVVAQAIAESYFAPLLPGLVLDIVPTGVKVKQFWDGFGKDATNAIKALANISPSSVVWGFDVTANEDGAYSDLFYFRPRASTIGQIFSVGAGIVGSAYTVDTTKIFNAIRILGGPADQPNNVKNGNLEFPLAPDELHGNLLQDASFELSYEGTSPYWTFGADATAKSIGDTGDGVPISYDGDHWVSLDQAGEFITQTFPVDASRPYVASAWVRRGNPPTAATFDFYVQGLAADGTTVIETTYFQAGSGYDAGAGSGPTMMPNFDGNPFNYQSATIPIEWASSLTKFAKVVLISHSGTNDNDGTFVDLVALYDVSGPVQDGWRLIASQCPYPAVLNMAHSSSEPGDGIAPAFEGTCLKIQAAPLTGGWAGIQNESWARAKLKINRIYTISAYVYVPLGETADVTVGVQQYSNTPGLNTLGAGGGQAYEALNAADPNNSTFSAIYESPRSTFVGDGDWHLVYYSFPAQTVEVDAEAFVKTWGTALTYIDGIGLWEGLIPAEVFQDGNYWDDQNYQKRYRSDDTDLDAAHTPVPGYFISPAAAASIPANGLRSTDLNISQVQDKATAAVAAIGYFNDTAIASTFAQLQLAAWTDNVDFGSKILIVNLPNAPGPLWPAKLTWEIHTSVDLLIDLNNEMPTMALVFQEQALHDLLRRFAAGSSGGGGSSPSTITPQVSFTGSGAGGGTGAAASGVDLTSDQTITGHKILAPIAAGVPLIVKAKPGDVVNDIVQFVDQSGAVVVQVKHNGELWVGGVQVTVP